MKIERNSEVERYKTDFGRGGRTTHWIWSKEAQFSILQFLSAAWLIPWDAPMVSVHSNALTVSHNLRVFNSF